MKKIILIGKTGCGKTTLTQSLNKKNIKYKKTQAIEYKNGVLDTPGEYIENRRFYNALIVSSSDCDIIGLVQDSTSDQLVFPPGFASMFNKPVVGIVTKIDCENKDVNQAIKYLRMAGVKKMFEVSSINNEGINNIRALLEEK
ncbi:EutP/PduV family microcompartment system protein [Dethiothermospora halolimnae]|uniref:EutP/PduV family microcompartment system protein n=1 Tax=Dethiothermospora halolimnae TaxID=3114390 RepID=UPI003CCBDEB4